MKKNPAWLKDAIFYEIYPQSFYDTNGDGIGDINGITAKLDYILSIGCNAIWINPCFDSPFKDAGYDVRDYKKVASRYGTNDDIYNLIKEAHKKGLKILLDLVPCHTSEEHEWFKKSALAKKNEYSERYVWTNDAFDKGSGNPFVGGEKPRNGCYAISFFNCQPCLNYGYYKVNQGWQHAITDEEPLKTREALKDIIRFWLDKGFDGFRVDMAACLVRNDVEEKGTQEVWKSIFSDIKSEYPEAAFISEWGVAHRAIKCGFDMDFYLDHGWDGGNGYHHLLRNHVLDDKRNILRDDSYFKFDSKTDPMKFFNEYLYRYYLTKDDGYICFMSNNHDMVRPSEFFSINELKLIFGFILTMPGCPFIYYGDEIGMKYLNIPTKEGGYKRTGSRTPMQWNCNKNFGFSTAKPSELYLQQDANLNAPTVENNENNKDSLLNLIRHLTDLRHNNPDLQSINNFELVFAHENSKLISYKRGKFLIVLNPSNEEYCLDFNHRCNEIFKITNGVTVKNGVIEVPTRAFSILEILD